MTNTNLILLTVLALLTVGLAGCSSNSGSSDAENRAQQLQADIAQANLEAQRANAQGYEKGYAAAKAVYDPPRHEAGNRTDRRTMDIEPGTQRVFNVTADHVMRLTYHITQYGGPRFDVFITSADNDLVLCAATCHPQPTMGDEFENCSDWDTATVERTCALPAGAWHIILDNTKAGGAAPDPNGDDETVRLKLTYTADWVVAS